MLVVRNGAKHEIEEAAHLPLTILDLSTMALKVDSIADWLMAPWYWFLKGARASHTSRQWGSVSSAVREGIVQK
jgi:hypothetical protein